VTVWRVGNVPILRAADGYYCEDAPQAPDYEQRTFQSRTKFACVSRFEILIGQFHFVAGFPNLAAYRWAAEDATSGPISHPVVRNGLCEFPVVLKVTARSGGLVELDENFRSFPAPGFDVAIQERKATALAVPVSSQRPPVINRTIGRHPARLFNYEKRRIDALLLFIDEPKYGRGLRVVQSRKFDLYPWVGLRRPIKSVPRFGAVEPHVQRITARARQQRLVEHFRFVCRTAINRRRPNEWERARQLGCWWHWYRAGRSRRPMIPGGSPGRPELRDTG
jgi:hypothetical protein